MKLNFTPLLQATVLGYRSPDSDGSNGAVGLSKILGISNGILSRKVSPTDSAAHLSPEELVRVCQETGDVSAFQAMAMELGYLLMPMHVASPSDTAPSLAGTFKELGEWLQAASAANSMPSVSDNTLSMLQRELLEGITASLQTFNELKGRHEAGKQTLRAVA